MRDPWDIDPVTGIDPMTLLARAGATPSPLADVGRADRGDGTDEVADQPAPEPWDWQTSPLEDMVFDTPDPCLPPAVAIAPAARSAADDGPSPGAVRFDLLSLEEIDDLPVPELDYVIDGLVPAGSLLLFAGREKEGKSLALLDAAVSVTAGEDWAGRSTTAGPVVYCPAEDSIRTVRDRLRRRVGGPLRASGRPLWVLPLSGVAVGAGRPAQRLDLNEPATVAGLRDVVRRTRPVLVVLDCLREVHGARENESDDMTVTMRPLRQMAHELNVAVVVVHHASKGASGSSRGSTAIAAACDAVATWTASGDGTGEGGAVPATTGPLRATLTIRGRDVPKTAITLELGDDLRFRPVAPAAGTGGPPVARDRILAALTDGGWRTAAEIAAAVGGVEGTTKNALTALLAGANPPIERSGPGTKNNPFRYRLTPASPQDASHHTVPLGALQVVTNDESDPGARWRH